MTRDAKPLPIEIERKFLLRNDDWRAAATHSVAIADGLLAASRAGKVRIRIAGTNATITVKGARQGLVRDEFEYPIPVADADDLMARHCAGPILHKTRSFVPYLGHVWQVDQYTGLLDGIILAEIELEHADQVVPLPPWLGREVTGDGRYRKANMVVERLGRFADALAPG